MTFLFVVALMRRGSVPASGEYSTTTRYVILAESLILCEVIVRGDIIGATAT